MAHVHDPLELQSERRVDREAVREFGGPIGAAAIMLGSHVILYYLWIAWRFYDGALVGPAGLSDVLPFLGRMWGHIRVGAAPTWSAFAIYGSFLASQALLAAVLPGIRVKGLPIPSQGGIRLEYNCNAIGSWYVTLLAVAGLHFSGLFPLTRVYEAFGSLMTVAILTGNAVAVATYVGARWTGNTHRMSGNVVYDLFMGAWLNPRLGPLDLKMWSEIRVSWTLLFLLTASAAAHQHATHGTISTPMLFMLVAHGLYTNACMKGDECIPTTWDIFYEKWGWMLIFWNFAGVPFVYCFNAMWLAQRPPFEHPVGYTIFCFALLLGAYYVWDTSLAQRIHFRMQQSGTYVKRYAFPQLPWATLKDPEYMRTANGSLLLVDGWWRYARKIPYTADTAMALSWGLVCGFERVLPYFYFAFFALMIGHRAWRDIQRCRRKYGADWDRYVQRVPWLFIPRVF